MEIQLVNKRSYWKIVCFFLCLHPDWGRGFSHLALTGGKYRNREEGCCCCRNAEKENNVATEDDSISRRIFSWNPISSLGRYVRDTLARRASVWVAWLNWCSHRAFMTLVFSFPIPIFPTLPPLPSLPCLFSLSYLLLLLPSTRLPCFYGKLFNYDDGLTNVYRFVYYPTSPYPYPHPTRVVVVVVLVDRVFYL